MRNERREVQEVIEYIHLPAGTILPETERRLRRVVVLIEQNATDSWQDEVSDWIVESGCLYMMAWGIDCSSWDDSVDYANLRQFDYEDIPDEDFVMTTWHDDEPISEVFFHCLMCAFHPTIELPLVTILHIVENERREEILKIYEQEKTALETDVELTAPPKHWLSRLKRLVFN